MPQSTFGFRQALKKIATLVQRHAGPGVSPRPDRHPMTQVSIAAPVEHCWQVLTDIAHYSAWNPFMPRLYMLGELIAKDVVLLEVRLGKRLPPLPLPATLVQTSPFELSWVGGIRKLAVMHHYYRLSEDPARPQHTLLDHGETFTGALIAPLWPKLEALLMPRYSAFNSAFKARCENTFQKVCP